MSINSTGAKARPGFRRWWTTVGVLMLSALLLTDGSVALAVGAVSAPAPWQPTAAMSIARSQHTATLLADGRVLVAGGEIGIGNTVTATAELYNPATHSWQPTGPMQTPRSGHTATLLPNGKVLVAGGVNFPAVLASAELYDPATGTWSTVASMRRPRHWHTATLLRNGTVLVTGGAMKLNEPSVASAEIYNPATNGWALTIGDLTAPRSQHTASLLPNGTVLIAGGGGAVAATVPASVNLYKPGGQPPFSRTGNLTTGRTVHTATVLRSGKVLVAGGSLDTALASAEVFDPTSGAWAATGSMIVSRTNFTATLLPDGTVLAVGGYGTDGYLPLRGSERYNAQTGRWTGAGSMSQTRFFHTATLLRDGSVLVTGGSTDAAQASATAELFVACRR